MSTLTMDFVHVIVGIDLVILGMLVGYVWAKYSSGVKSAAQSAVTAVTTPHTITV